MASSTTTTPVSPQQRKVQSNWQRFVSRRILTTQRPAQHLLRGLFIGLGVALLASFMLYQNSFLEIRSRLKDGLYSSPAATSGNIVIIAIDNQSLETLGRSPATWDRTEHAELIRFLADARARVVTFDLFFDIGADGDDEIAEAMEGACRPTPLGTCIGTEVILAAVGGQVVEETIEGTSIYINISRPTEILTNAPGRLGHVSVRPDDDGFLREVPLIIEEVNQPPLASLGLATFLSYQRLDENSVRYEAGELRYYIDPAGTEYTVVRDLPTNDFPRMLIYFFGPPSKPNDENSTYPTYSYIDVIEGKIPTSVFENKIVLVGILEADAQPDNFPVPIMDADEEMYGVEIHANIIETIYQAERSETRTRNLKLPLVEQSKSQQYLFIGLFALLAGAILPFLRWYVALIVTLFAYAFFYFLYANIVLIRNGTLVELFFPALSLALVFIGTVISNYVFEERRRAEINDLFSRYVSTDIAQKILESYDKGELELGGEEREVTVMFADVRGFTTLSEGLPPREVVRMLNVFLERMNEIVLKHGGAINKYIGDNLMAFWNAPYFQDDHAWRATQAALELLEAIKDINAQQQFKTSVQFGIGINTGMVVVGNIGSQQRLEYTPIGDTVNVASRLSGVAEGGACLVGPGTFIYITNRMKPTRQISVRLKGKAQELVVYEFRPDGVSVGETKTAATDVD
jgi:adenylate cyclase